MENKNIFRYCKEIGCCNTCCIRFLGLKNPKFYENIKEYTKRFLDIKEEKDIETPNCSDVNGSNCKQSNSNGSVLLDNIATDHDVPPPCKKRKEEYCVSCLGILQEETWPAVCQMIKDALERKRYDCKSFACALSSPMTLLLREKIIMLMIKEKYADYDLTILTPLKEAWKNTLGVAAAEFIKITLDSGAVSPLLVTVTMDLPDDLQELEVLKKTSPSLFAMRNQMRRRFAIEFTRHSVEQAIDGLSLASLKSAGWEGLSGVCAAKCVSVATLHAPCYLGGRYIKLSRELPQSPWVINGKRMMESSVQEIIFEPVAKVMGIEGESIENRFKFLSAGREDVDVRCLGEGRPFAIEISDPHRMLSTEELSSVCEEISKSGKVVVRSLLHVDKDDLSELKKGEETKCKTYEALCIKLDNTKIEKESVNGNTDIYVTEADIERINSYRNTPTSEDAIVTIVQKTPIRVLHRRPALSRTRSIYEMSAKAVQGHSRLFTLRIRTQAGTYIKEFVHGEVRRSRPSLSEIVGAPVDILALDVAKVHLDWPNKNV